MIDWCKKCCGPHFRFGPSKTWTLILDIYSVPPQGQQAVFWPCWQRLTVRGWKQTV